MNVESAFVLTPAAIIGLAYVWRHPWGDPLKPGNLPRPVGPRLDLIGRKRIDQCGTLDGIGDPVAAPIRARHGGLVARVHRDLAPRSSAWW